MERTDMVTEETDRATGAVTWAQRIRGLYRASLELLGWGKTKVDGHEFTDLSTFEDYVRDTPWGVWIREDWHHPDDPPTSAVEFEIVLATSAPAVRIAGWFDSDGEPYAIRMEESPEPYVPGVPGRNTWKDRTGWDEGAYESRRWFVELLLGRKD